MNEQELLLTTVKKCRRLDLYVDPKPLTQQEQDQFTFMQKRRKEGEPFQYIVNTCEFMGLSFFVDKRVLIPRPETELLVEAILTKCKGLTDYAFRILDLGTGSGNIAVSLAKYLPQSKVDAVDISQDALEVGFLNAHKHNVQNRITFLKHDMKSYLKSFVAGGNYDIIVSNPPYIPTEDISKLSKEIHCEPKIALDGGKDGLNFYSDIIEYSPLLLAKRGLLAFEIGDNQRSAIENMFAKDKRFSKVEFYKDYTQTDRMALAVL